MSRMRQLLIEKVLFGVTLSLFREMYLRRIFGGSEKIFPSLRSKTSNTGRSTQLPQPRITAVVVGTIQTRRN